MTTEQWREATIEVVQSLLKLLETKGDTSDVEGNGEVFPVLPLTLQELGWVAGDPVGDSFVARGLLCDVPCWAYDLVISSTSESSLEPMPSKSFVIANVHCTTTSS